MCGGSQKSSQTSTYKPTQQASNLYTNIIDQATTAAATPYNPATGQQVAGFTPDQLAAFGMVADNQGSWSPYIDQSAQLMTQAAGPISADAIRGYMDPYQQMVIDAALAQSGRADAIAQNNLKGNAIAGGALGGNAPGVAAAQLAGEQGRNRDTMLANLLSGGYSQALSAAQSDAARQAGLGAQFGQLAQTVQGLGLNDIAARLGIGNQQQQQTQSQLDAASSNAAAETMWPYQNAQWLASIGAGIGPLTGGTTTGTSKTSQGKGVGQIVGAGLSAASLLSDRRAKEDERVIGRTFDGQKVYSFRYKGSNKTQIGLMADEVRQHHPEAVMRGADGLDRVNYDAAMPYANGGSVQGNSPFGGRGASFFPWAPIVASQPTMPQLAPMSGGGEGGGSSDPFSDPQQAIKLGKSARSGIQDFMKQFDGAGGWAASIEPTSGAGKGLGSLGSLFGFRDGGEVRMARAAYDDMPEDPYSEAHIPIDFERANRLTDMFVSDPTMYGDNATGSEEVMRRASGMYPPSLAVGSPFANGGGVKFAFLSPDVMSPYDLRPDRVPPLKDEFIGEIGPSGADEPPAPNAVEELGGQLPADVLREKFPRPTPPAIDPEIAASNERMMRSFEEAEAAGRKPWYRQSATDLLGITDGASDPRARLTMPPQERISETPDTVADPVAPSPWSIDNGVVRYKGQSFADWMSGTKPAVDSGDIDAGSTPYLPNASNDTAMGGPFGTTVEETPSKKTDRPPMPSEGEPFDAIGFIKQQEGFAPEAKWDRRQWSSGYGTRAVQGEKITRQEAERRLNREVGKVENWLNDNVSADMTPQQRGGLLSFGFNLGTGALGKLKGDINKGDWGRVATRMRSFNKALNEDTGELEEVGGLTDRRTREAALVSGGSSLGTPTVEDVAPLVSKGTDAEAPTGRYSGPKDRETGGLLKRWFGIDFNPLRLSEDERQGLLVAGLSMMSTGDIGGGGLAGLRYMQQRATTDREAAMAAAKLGMDMFKTAADLGIAQERLDLERTGKPTDDARNYELAKSEGYGGSFMDFMREKKLIDKGGTELPAEVAARIGLGRVFMKDAPAIRQQISQFTAGDRADLALGRGRAADVWRRIESGREALVRQLTGAGMSQAEAENQAKRYQIRADDKLETMARKVEMLERDLTAVEEGALAGKTGVMSRQYQSGASNAPQARPRARNPKTGQVVEYDGSRWLEVTP